MGIALPCTIQLTTSKLYFRQLVLSIAKIIGSF
jgi:hypothetical protein